jgi:Protein of unknown function (DUF3631)
MGVIGYAVRSAVREHARQERHDQADTARQAPVAVRTGVVVPRPPANPVPGDLLLDVTRQWIGTYAALGEPELDTVTLWAAHCHARDEARVLVFRVTPRLWLLSSKPGSGKTRILELLNLICPRTFDTTLEPTMPGLVKTISQEQATVLIDEGDILFGSGKRRESVRAVINGGYRRTGTVLTGSRGKATRDSVFGPIAVAALDAMESQTGDTLKATLSRGIKIRMHRAVGDAAPARLDRTAEEQGAKLQAFLAAWAAQERDALTDATPEIPEGVEGRAAEIWEPLLAIADAAGGHWPDRARAACQMLALAGPRDDGELIGNELRTLAAGLANR